MCSVWQMTTVLLQNSGHPSPIPTSDLKASLVLDCSAVRLASRLVGRQTSGGEHKSYVRKTKLLFWEQRHAATKASIHKGKSKQIHQAYPCAWPRQVSVGGGGGGIYFLSLSLYIYIHIYIYVYISIYIYIYIRILSFK